MELYTRSDDMRGQHMHIINMDIKHKDAQKILGRPHRSGIDRKYNEIYEWRWELFNGVKFSISMSNSDYAFEKRLKKVPTMDKVDMMVIKGELSAINMLREYFKIMLGKGDEQSVINYIFTGNS